MPARPHYRSRPQAMPAPGRSHSADYAPRRPRPCDSQVTPTGHAPAHQSRAWSHSLLTTPHTVHSPTCRSHPVDHAPLAGHAPLPAGHIPTRHSHLVDHGHAPTGHAPTPGHAHPTPLAACGPSSALEACAAWHTGPRAPLRGSGLDPHSWEVAGTPGASPQGWGLTGSPCKDAVWEPVGLRDHFPSTLRALLWASRACPGSLRGSLSPVSPRLVGISPPLAHPSWGPGGPVLRRITLTQVGRGCGSRAASAPRYPPALTSAARGCGRPERVRCRLHVMAGTEPGLLGAQLAGWR